MQSNLFLSTILRAIYSIKRAWQLGNLEIGACEGIFEGKQLSAKQAPTLMRL